MKSALIFILSLELFTGICYSQSSMPAHHKSIFAGTVNVSVEGGATFSRTDYTGTGVDYLGRASIEYTFPSGTISTLGLKLFGGGGYLTGKDSNKNPDYFRTEMYSFGGGLVYMVSVKNDFFPYLFAGVSVINFSPQGRNGKKLPNNLADKYSNSELNYNIELGFKVKATNNLNIFVNGGLQLSPNDNLDDITAGSAKDMFFISTAGVGYSFGGFHDADEDGVEDSKDMCPETNSGIPVDENGCPKDADNDGVPDYLDKCPNTGKGIRTDANGCPVDSDEDGVPDYTDLCPNTPKSIDIDSYGCPFDHDADGIPDYLDKCKDTPPGAQVDESGCPLDTDHDGVPDYLDKCPGSPAGARVDANGCPPVSSNSNFVWGREKTVLGSSATFNSGKTELLPSAYPVLDRLVKIMRERPETRWMVEGYTDNVGRDELNQELSLKRAEAVVDYFFSKGIAKTRFTLVGKGESDPVADNNTSSGRAKNRRVVIYSVK